MPMKITIKDIAEKAGVSVAAVSKALNGQPDVGEKTREKILKISDDLGYTPNMIARNLVKKGNNTLGVLIPDISTPIYPSIYKGINETARNYGYTLLLGDTNRNPETEAKYVRTMMENRVAGLLVSPVSNDISHFKQLLKGQTPIIYFGGKVNDAMENYIGINNVYGASIAMDHLISLGHRNIVMFTDNSDTKTRHDRIDGYTAVMRRENLEPRVMVNEEGLKARECGVALIRSMLEKGEKLPTAIFALNDLMAIGAMEALIRKGFRVPEDVSVIGYDDISYASLPMISLSTVSQPKFKIGEMAVEIIHRILSGERSGADQKIILQPELKVRNSTREI